MIELKKSIPKVKEHLIKIIEGISNSKCTNNDCFHENSYIGYVCLANSCNKRLICTKCINEDVDHISQHSRSIINLKQFEGMAHDRCIDMFADDIEKNSNEIEYKYGKKQEKLAKSCQEVITQKLTREFPVKIDHLKMKYKEQIGEPVKEINNKVMDDINEYCTFYQNKLRSFDYIDLKQPEYVNELNHALEEQVDYIGAKGQYEKELWETSGKILQRQKHSFLYNTELDKKQDAQVRVCTEKYIKKVLRIFQKQFYGEDEIIDAG